MIEECSVSEMQQRGQKNQDRLVSVGIYPRPLHKAGCGTSPFFFFFLTWGNS